MRENLMAERHRIATAKWTHITEWGQGPRGYWGHKNTMVADEPLMQAIEAFRRRKLAEIDALLASA